MSQKRITFYLISTLVILLIATNVSVGQANILTAPSDGPQSVDDRGGLYQVSGLEPTPTPIPELNSFQTNGKFTFAELGKTNYTIHFPGSMSIYVPFPYRWAIIPSSSTINIHYAVLDVSGNPVEISDLEAGLWPFAEVYVDDVLAGVFTPQSGIDQTVTFTFPQTAAVSRNLLINARTIRIDYARGRDCELGGDTALQIYNDSFISFGFNVNLPDINLANFPRPITSESFLQETLQFIIPDKFSEGDLTAAAMMAGAFGNQSSGTVKINVLKASDVTRADLEKSNAVIIGQPSKNVFIDGLYKAGLLPTSLNGDLIASSNIAIQPDDGVVQMIPSHINAEYVYLIVSGGSDAGVIRAASGLASADPEMGLNGNLAVIQAVNDTSEEQKGASDEILTFEDLKAGDWIFYGVTTEEIYIPFFIPRNWRIKSNPSLLIEYTHSANLSTANSTITVEMNGRLVGSLPVDKSTAGRKKVTIPLSPDDFKPGERNLLHIIGGIGAELDCSAYNPLAYWLEVFNTSLIYVPHDLITDADDQLMFTNPFYYLTYKPNVVISLPAEPNKDELDGMTRFAQLLGSTMLDPLFKYSVSMGSADLPREGYEGYNVVAIGRPTRNPLIAAINDKLPQPFVAGEDALQQKVGDVIYRLPANFTIGVIEVIPADWDPSLGVTVVSGTNDAGVKDALTAFGSEGRVDKMAGEISYISGYDIEAILLSSPARRSLETVIQDMTNQQPALEPVSTKPTPTMMIPGTTQETRPKDYSLFLIIPIILVGIAVIVFGVLQITRRRGRLM